MRGYMSEYKVTLPDYDRCILSISSSLLKYYNADYIYKSLPEIDKELKAGTKNVVFLILDCLGASIIDKHLGEESFIKKHMVTKITSVFPPTTTAATTSFHSGLSPFESGWIGWMAYFKEHDRIIELFLNTDFYTREYLDIPSIPAKVLPYKSIYEKITEKNTDVVYSQIFPPFMPDGCTTFDEMCERIVKQTSKPCKNIISAYWNEPDTTIHVDGVDGSDTKAVVKYLDKRVSEMAAQLPKDTVLIITADHGAVDVQEIDINGHKIAEYLKRPPSFEARYVTLFIKEGMIESFRKEFLETFGNDFLLYTKDEFIKSGLLGRGTPHKRTLDFIGDFVAISKSNKSIRYFMDGYPAKKLNGDHAGITYDEMMVPVVLFRT